MTGFASKALAAVPLLVGGAATGVGLYDLLKARSFPTVTFEDVLGPEAKRVDPKVLVKQLLEKKPLRKPPIVVTGRRDFEKVLPRLGLDPEQSAKLRQAVASVFWGLESPFAARIGDIDLLVLPEKIQRAVVEHEMGHLREIEAGRDPGAGSTAEQFASLVWWPTFAKYVQRPEEAAWSHVRRQDAAREKMLGTYERTFHERRGTVAGLAGALLLGGALLQRLAAKGN